MASTYSTLKVELIGTGEQTGTWGTTTNDNLSVALGEAITGSADVAFSSADVTVTLTDTNGAQTARNLRLNLTGTSGGARNLILGSGCQIEKLYLINNGLADAVTVKNTSGTGIAVAAGKTMFVYNNGTNVVEAITQFNGTIALASGVTGILPIANGGTGSTSTTFVNLTSNVTGTLPIANGGTGSTSTTFVNAATNVTGTLPVANGGTGLSSTPSNGQLDIGNGSGFSRATLTAGSGISITNGSGSITIASTGGSEAQGGRGQVFTSSGTFTLPTGVTAIKATVVAGGGGGGATSNQSGGGGGGGGGGYAIQFFTGLTPGNTLSVTVGGGGAGNSGANGSTGGTSSVASGTQSITTVSATGGSGGTWSQSGNPGSGGGGGGTSGGAWALTGGSGSAGGGVDENWSGSGGAAGASNGTRVAQLSGSIPGSGPFGGGGASAFANQSGAGGVGYGSGGGGAYFNAGIGQAAGGSGSAGFVWIEY